MSHTLKMILDHWKSELKDAPDVIDLPFNLEEFCRQNDALIGLHAELMNQLYGPRFCKHCNQIQPITIYELNGSFNARTEGTLLVASFTGVRCCTVCHRAVT